MFKNYWTFYANFRLMIDQTWNIFAPGILCTFFQKKNASYEEGLIHY